MRLNLYRLIVAALVVSAAVALAVRRGDVPDRFEGFRPVAIEHLPDGSLSGTNMSGMGMQQHLVIRDAATWAKVWQQIATNGPPPPVVDFARQVVIVAALGARHGSGYSIDITEVRVRGGDAVVFLEEHSPGPECITLAVETAPTAFAIVPEFPGVAMFVDHPVVWSCH